jgi:hypothetical protein
MSTYTPERISAARQGRWGASTASDRFWARVEKTDGCWLWTGYRDRSGYGFAGRRLAHRVAYEWTKGPIPTGLDLDHLCRTPACVNPDHLEPVPHRVNILRGEGRSAIAFRGGTCVNGHIRTDENTYVVPRTGKRNCKTCLGARRASRPAQTRAKTPEQRARHAANQRRYAARRAVVLVAAAMDVLP